MRLAALSILSACAPAWGCHQPGYRPVAPHFAVRPGLTAQINRVDFERQMNASLTVEALAPAQIRRILLAPSDAEPCREGIRESDARLDRQPIWARPIELTVCFRQPCVNPIFRWRAIRGTADTARTVVGQSTLSSDVA